MRIPRSIRRVMLGAAVVAGGLLTLTYLLYRRDIGPAYERISTGSQIAPTRCGPIEYAVKGEGPPVLVVHGAGGGFDQGLRRGRFNRARRLSRDRDVALRLPPHAPSRRRHGARAGRRPRLPARCSEHQEGGDRRRLGGRPVGAAVRAAFPRSHGGPGAAGTRRLRAATEPAAGAHVGRDDVLVQRGAALRFPLLGRGQARARHIHPLDPRHAVGRGGERVRRGASTPGDALRPYPADQPPKEGTAQRRGRDLVACRATNWRRLPRPHSRSARPTTCTAPSTALAIRPGMFRARGSSATHAAATCSSGETRKRRRRSPRS